MTVVLVAVGLQLALPERLGLRLKLLLRALEGALLVALVVADPGRLQSRHPALTRSTWLSRLIRQRVNTACTVEGARPTRAPIATGPSRCFHRRCTILRTTGCGVRVGCRCGRQDRSAIPARPRWPSSR